MSAPALQSPNIHSQKRIPATNKAAKKIASSNSKQKHPNSLKLHKTQDQRLEVEVKHAISIHGEGLTDQEIKEMLELRKKNLVEDKEPSPELAEKGFIEYRRIIGEKNLEFENFKREILAGFTIIVKRNGHVIAYRQAIPMEKIKNLGLYHAEIANLVEREKIPLNQGLFSTEGCVEEQYRGMGISRLMFKELATLTERQYFISTIYDKNESSKTSQEKIGAWEIARFGANGKPQCLYALSFNKIAVPKKRKLKKIKTPPSTNT